MKLYDRDYTLALTNQEREAYKAELTYEAKKK